MTRGVYVMLFLIISFHPNSLFSKSMVSSAGVQLMIDQSTKPSN